MKRLLSCLLCIVLIFGCFTTVLADEPSEEIDIGVPDELLRFGGREMAVTAEPVPAFQDEEMASSRWGSMDASLGSAPAETQAVHAVVIPTPYTDISSSNWFYNSAAICYEMGFMKGTSARTFTPDSYLTRAELVTILFRIENTYRSRNGKSALNPSTSCGFTDVSKDSYYAQPVTWAYQNGIVAGVSSKSFAPNDLVTREQIAAICYRYYKEYYGRTYGSPANLNGYSDYRDISDYARTAVAWAVDIGFMAGKTSKTLAPKEPATRAETAVFAERIYLLLLSNGVPRSSQAMLNFIMEREGFAETPYWDYSQWSVGYGSRCGVKRDGSDVPSLYWNGITQSEAQLLLKYYMEDFAEYNVELFEERSGITFTQGQFDAMADFTYALGPLWMASSNQPNQITTWLKKPGTDLALVNALGAWCHVGSSVSTGTADRRVREALVFLYNDYSGTATTHPSYAAVRYVSKESYLDGDYKEAMGYYVVGKAYSSLLIPEYRPVSGTAFKMFNGWVDPNGRSVNNNTIVSGNTTLTARWQ